MVAATAGDCAPPSAGAAVFSSPGVLAPIANRSNTNVLRADAGRSRLVTLADANDPVLYGANESNGLQGAVCVWNGDVPRPPACAACFAGRPPRLNMSSPACEACFLAKHIFAHYYKALVPGPPPRCVARDPCPDAGACPPHGSCALPPAPAAERSHAVRSLDEKGPRTPALRGSAPPCRRNKKRFGPTNADPSRNIRAAAETLVTGRSAHTSYPAERMPAGRCIGCARSSPAARLSGRDSVQSHMSRRSWTT